MPLYKFKLKTMSPIHIGDGEMYDGMTLMPVDKKFIPLDFPLIFRIFEKHNVSLNNFKTWLLDEKKKRHYRKPSIEEFLKESYRNSYSQIEQSFEQSATLKLANLSLTRISADINTCLKDMNKHPYISGSELKGAIVTALLFSILKEDPDFYKELNKVLNKNKAVLDEMYDSMIKVKDLTLKKKDAGFRNFRDLRIPREDWSAFRRILSMRSDKALSQIEQELRATKKYSDQRVREIVDAIDEWREGDKKNYNDQIRREKRRYDRRRIKGIADQISVLEDAYKEKYLNISDDSNNHKLMRFFQIADSKSINESKISSCLIVHRNPRITMNLFFEIIDSNTTTEATCRINHQMGDCMNYLNFDVEMKNFIEMKNIKQAIHQFSKAVLAEEQAYFKSLEGGYRFQVNEVLSQLNELEKANQPDSPLLRIGKGQGFLSLTMALLLRAHDAKHNTQIYSKLIGVVQSEKNNPNNYPITRRLIADGSGKLKLPGWVKINVEEVAP